MAASSSASGDAAVNKVVVPVGHIVVSERWRRTELVATLQKKVQVDFEDSLGVVDFHPASHTGVIYVSEADLVSGNTGYKRKCAQLRKANKVQGIVLVEKTDTTDQYYKDMQMVVALEMGLTLIPVPSQEYAADLLAEMVATEEHPERNPFRFNRLDSDLNLNDAMLATLQSIPGVSLTKAKMLLESFHCLHGVGAASQLDIARAAGVGIAEDVWCFFNGPLSPDNE